MGKGSTAPFSAFRDVRPALTASDEELRTRFEQLRSARDVARILEIPHKLLCGILYGTCDRGRYRQFRIPKRRGGYRDISSPPKNLSILQSKLAHILKIVYRPKPAAHGFVGERSIVSCAKPHVGKRYVLNIDLEDFFSSINFGRVRGMFISEPYTIAPPAATILAQICCDATALPQGAPGAPTSPIVSNMICRSLDNDLQQLAQQYQCHYTRYADDITLSASRRKISGDLVLVSATGPVQVGPVLDSIVKKNGFQVNAGKVRLQVPSQRQEVTGLTVNEFPNVRRTYVRQIRAMLHAWEKYGHDAAEREFRLKYDRTRSRNRREKSFRHVVRGKLDFLSMVRGRQDPIYQKLCREFGLLRTA